MEQQRFFIPLLLASLFFARITISQNRQKEQAFLSKKPFSKLRNVGCIPRDRGSRYDRKGALEVIDTIDRMDEGKLKRLINRGITEDGASIGNWKLSMVEPKRPETVEIPEMYRPGDRTRPGAYLQHKLNQEIEICVPKGTSRYDIKGALKVINTIDPINEGTLTKGISVNKASLGNWELSIVEPKGPETAEIPEMYRPGDRTRPGAYLQHKYNQEIEICVPKGTSGYDIKGALEVINTIDPVNSATFQTGISKKHHSIENWELISIVEPKGPETAEIPEMYRPGDRTRPGAYLQHKYNQEIEICVPKDTSGYDIKGALKVINTIDPVNSATFQTGLSKRRHLIGNWNIIEIKN